MRISIAIVIALAACSTSAPRPDHTTTIAARRAQMLAWLHDYQEAGQFPTDAAGRPRSVFRDDKGVRCPMAELIFRSGRGDLVDAVVATRNDLRLADVRTGPLAEWMAHSGLTRDEIDLIQGVLPIYDQFELKRVESPRIAFAPEIIRERVRGRIETVEVVLREGTESAVQTIALDLDATPAVAPGPVVPPAVEERAVVSAASRE